MGNLQHHIKMGRGPKKHQKRLSAPSHWLLDKLSGAYAPKASPGPHKTRDCLPLIVFLRNRLKYALNGRETNAILMQRLIKVDGKVRTDVTYPAGFMDVISTESNKLRQNTNLARSSVFNLVEEESHTWLRMMLALSDSQTRPSRSTIPSRSILRPERSRTSFDSILV